MQKRVKQNNIVRLELLLESEFKKIRIIGASKKLHFYRTIC